MERVVIGDVHGKAILQFVTLLLKEGKKVILVGDYVDSFDKSNAEIIALVEGLIALKKACGDALILLLGNHDISYILPRTDSIRPHCDGYRAGMAPILNMIFNANLSMFKYAHVETIRQRQVLFTHAGVTKGWYKQFRKLVFHPEYSKFKLFDGMQDAPIDELLNFAFDVRVPNLFFNDINSGGTAQWASPLWVRPKTLKIRALPFMDQVVGHTRVDAIELHTTAHGDRLYFIDCLKEEDLTNSILHEQAMG